MTPGAGYSVSQAVRRDGTRRPRRATTAARSRTSTWTPARRSTARSRTRSAARGGGRRRGAERRPGLLVHGRGRAQPDELLARRRLGRHAVQHAHASTTCRPAPGTRCRRTPARPAGTRRAPPAATAARSSTSACPPGETVTCTFTNNKRGQIVVVKDAQPNDAQDFAFTAGGGLTPGELHARRRRRRHALEHDRPSRRRARLRLLGLRERSRAAGSRPARSAATAARCRTSASVRRRDRHVHVHQPQARPDRGRQGRAARTTRRTSRSRPAAACRPTSFQLDDDADGDAVQHAHVHERRARHRLLRVGDRARRLGPVERHLQRRQPASRTSTSAPARRSRARSRTASAARSCGRRTPCRTIRRTSASRPAAGSRPTSFQLDDHTNPTLPNTITFTNLAGAHGYFVSQTVPTRLGPDERHLQRRQPGLEHRRGPGRDGHVHVRRTSRTGSITIVKDAQPNDAAGLLVHGRRRPVAARASSSTTTPTARCSNTRAVRERARRARYSVVRDGAGRLGPGERDLQRRQPGVRTSTSAPARTSPARSRTRNAARSWSSRTPSRTTPQDFAFTAGGGLVPASFSLDDDADGTLSNTQTFTNVLPGAGLLARPRRCRPAGRSRSATCSDGSPVSNIDVAPGETVTCTFTNQKRGSIMVVKDATPNDPQDFAFTAGGGLQPGQLLARRRRRRHAVEHAHLRRRGARLGLLAVGDGAERLGPDQRHLQRRQPGVEHRRRAGRDRHLHVRQPQARPDRRRQGRHAERPAGLLLHGRRRPPPGQLLARRRRRRHAVEHAHLHERRARLAATRSSETRAGRLGPDRARRATTAARVSNIDVAAGETVTCTFSNRKRGEIVVVKDSLPNDPQDFAFTAGGGLSPASFSLDDDADADAVEHAHVHQRRAGLRLLAVARRCRAAGTRPSATCDDGSPLSNIDLSRGRDGHLHVHEPQARADRGGQGRAARRPAGLRLHGRRRALARRASRSTTTPTATLSNTPHLHQRRARAPATRSSETVPERLGPDRRHLQRRQPGVQHRRRRRARPSPARSRTTSAGRSRSSRTRVPDDAQDFTFTAGGGLSPASFALDDDLDPDALEHAGRSTTCRRPGYSVAETVPSGWDQASATCDDGSPSSNIDARRGRDRHLHVHEHASAARSWSSRTDARTTRRTSTFTAGGGLSAPRASSSTTTPTRRCRTRSTFTDVAPGERLLAGRDGAGRLGPDRAPPATTAARCRTSTSRPARRSPARSRTASAARSWSSRTPRRTTRRTSRSRPAAASVPASFSLDDDSDGDAVEHAHASRTSRPGTATRSPRPCPAAGTRPAPRAATAARCRTSLVSAGETVTCTFTEPQARRSLIVVKDAAPNDPQDFSFTAGGGLSPGELPARRRLRRRRCPNTHTFDDVAPGCGYSLSETVPGGWDQASATCDDGSPVVEHRRVGRARPSPARSRTSKRGQIVVVKDAVPERPAGLLLHGRRRPRRRRASQLDDDADATLSNTRTFTDVSPAPATRRRDRPGRLGPDQRHLRRRQPGRRTSTSRPARPSPARSRTASAARSSSSRTPCPTTRRTSRSRPAAASRPASFALDDDARPDAARTRARSTTCSRRRRLLARRDRARRLGPDRAPPATTAARVVEHRRVAPARRSPAPSPNHKRGQIVVVKDAHAQRPAGLLLHGRRRPQPDQLPARRRLRRDAVEHPHVRERAVPAPATRSPRPCRAAGTRSAPPATTAARCRTSTSRPARPSPARSRTASAAQHRGREGRAPQRPAGLLLHGRRRAVAVELRARRRLRRHALRTRARSSTCRPARATRSPRPCHRLGPDERDLLTTAARSRTSPWRRRDRHLHVHEPQARPDRDRGQGRGPQRPAGLRLHGRRRPLAGSFALDDDSDATLAEHAARSTTSRPAAATRSRETVPSGWDLTSATCDDGSPSRTSTSRRARPSPARSRTASAGRSWSSRTRMPERPQDFSFTAGGGLSPVELRARRRLRPDARRTRARSRDVLAGQRLLARRDRALRLGPDQRDLRRRQPGLEHRRRARRDRHLHVHEPQARARSSSSRTPRPNDPQDFSFTAGGGLTPGELLARRRLRPDAVRTRARSTNVVARHRLLASPRPCPRLGPDQRDLRRRQPGLEHRVSRR